MHRDDSRGEEEQKMAQMLEREKSRHAEREEMLEAGLRMHWTTGGGAAATHVAIERLRRVPPRPTPDEDRPTPSGSSAIEWQQSARPPVQRAAAPQTPR